MFWEHGYEGVDVERIARAVNVTKPALYRAFGDKPTLLLKAVERYAMTYIAPIMAAFQAEPDIHKAVTAFCEAIVNNATGEARYGCMMAAAARKITPEKMPSGCNPKYRFGIPGSRW
jgi:AcrR family transcriptional regulator